MVTVLNHLISTKPMTSWSKKNEFAVKWKWKKEPIVKQDPGNQDSIFLVSRRPHTANVMTIDGLIDDDQLHATSDFIDFCHLDEVKSEVKIEKIKEEVLTKM